ncbi:hypothetical protein PaG_02779 [Moesziomyces aphidis]|uniref:Uncharacterized protein n=1 Tax=Moesziomyces aphidis TaxID=84754 RepID=W3VQE0_MOEAP|nr:hypothetical protein PaG_02779 [Moesziomyces aphidis]
MGLRRVWSPCAASSGAWLEAHFTFNSTPRRPISRLEGRSPLTTVATDVVDEVCAPTNHPEGVDLDLREAERSTRNPGASIPLMTSTSRRARLGDGAQEDEVEVRGAKERCQDSRAERFVDPNSALDESTQLDVYGIAVVAAPSRPRKVDCRCWVDSDLRASTPTGASLLALVRGVSRQAAPPSMPGAFRNRLAAFHATRAPASNHATASAALAVRVCLLERKRSFEGGIYDAPKRATQGSADSAPQPRFLASHVPQVIFEARHAHDFPTVGLSTGLRRISPSTSPSAEIWVPSPSSKLPFLLNSKFPALPLSALSLTGSQSGIGHDPETISIAAD